MTLIAAIVIGRNEGARLERSLATLQGQVAPLIYVDSGSSDASVAVARAAGAVVVELSPDTPFTAARARAEGMEALQAMAKAGSAPEYVQFIDGDCELVSGWLAAGLNAFSADPKLGLVTGWRTEMHPNASIYNALCDYEWHRPAGEIQTCGGDMLVRAQAYREAGGFRGDVIAAEDDEFCLRLGKAGWGLRRLPLNMTRHDAAMTRFSEWWQRAVRSGHGFAQVGHLHPEFFVPERRRVWLYAGFLPVLAIMGAALHPFFSLVVLAIYGLSFVRTAQGLKPGLSRAGLGRRAAFHHAFYLTLSKFPNFIGLLTYHLRRLRGADMRIIEYK